MAGYERTRKGIRNSFVAVAVQFVSLLVGFFSRKIFLDYLGTEVLGLNTTATSLLSFLNLAEMGIETAIASTLYRPLFEKDEVSIREIIAIQGWFYRRVALFIIIGSLALMPFFPMIFTKMQLPMWYAYASYLVLLFSSMLGYFVNYKQVILTADQQDYKFQMSYRLTMIVKVVFQMLSVRYLDHPYVWWLVFEAVFAILAAVRLNSAVYQNYPFLKEKCRVDRVLIVRYPQILTKIKQLFVHRMGYYLTGQSIPIFIYAFASLSTVALYGNYMVLVNSIQAVLLALFSSVTASVGNMIAEDDKNLIVKVFRELFSARFAIVVFCCFCLYFLTEPFISLWLGPEYILDRRTLILIIIIFFISNIRTVVDVFINAFGIFKDIWCPIAEAVVFVVSAILLGRVYGLDGVLWAQVIELTLLVILWKPYFLFRNGMGNNPLKYFLLFVKLLMISAALFALVYFLLDKFTVTDPYGGMWPFVLYSVVLAAGFLLLVGCIFLLAEKGTRNFLSRVFKILGR